MPRATCRIIPARTRSLWLTTSASAGSSRKVGARYDDSRLTAAPDTRRRRPPPASRRSLRLMLVLALEHEPAVAPGRARGHRHRDEDRLGELLLGRAGLLRPLHVRVDAPGTLGDLRDAERDQLLRLDV